MNGKGQGVSPSPTPENEQNRTAGPEAARHQAVVGEGGIIDRIIDSRIDDLIAVRRRLHADPELSHQEFRTTALIAAELRDLGLEPSLTKQTGLFCDIRGTDDSLRPVALRADMDALGIPDLKKVEYRSRNDGVSHACGHDVHMTCVLGAAMALRAVQAAGRLKRTVRLVFQPSEESPTPPGALQMVKQGVVDGIDSIYALHCDPSFDVGRIGMRTGPITSAADPISIELRGAGGHTSRPHNTQDLICAMGLVATQLPAMLTRRLDPRSGVNLTWGSIHAGSTFNAIPSSGQMQGTLRCLDRDAWDSASTLLEELLVMLVRPLGVEASVHHTRGIPPVTNDARCVRLMERTAAGQFGPESVGAAPQSLGGEDFAWYLGKVPGALGRLGTRTPGGRTYDLHMGDLVIDERAIRCGAGFLAALCVQRDQKR